MNALLKLAKKQKGQSMTEYGLIISLVAVAIVMVLAAFGGVLKSMFGNIAEALKISLGS